MSDAFEIGESWISEHYFSSDGKQSFRKLIIAARKEWNNEEESVRTRFTGMRSSLVSQFAALGEESLQPQRRAELHTELHADLRALLGFYRPGLNITKEGPLHHVAALGLESQAPLVIVEATSGTVEELLSKDEPNLITPYEVDEKTTITSTSRLLSHVFTAEDAPEFALVQSGKIAMIAQKTRWAEGRYLAIDLQVVADRNELTQAGEVERALTCLQADSLAPDAEGNIWWSAVLEESVKHTIGVSQDLREGVRRSIEIIGNEVVARRQAQGLEPLPADQAQVLAKQALRFLYRILFLLYAEASPELKVLPTGVEAYDRGYSLDRLRELTLIELEDPRSQYGTHLYESLGVLFRLVDQGHSGVGADRGESGEAVSSEGLSFNELKADLFLPSAISLIEEVQLGNQELQRVLQYLLLSKEGRNRKGDRGFISYAELGINQLGAVYEGLMSYTGFFAAEDLHEVAKDGNAEKGSWVVPVTRSQHLRKADFVKVTDPITNEPTPVIHKRGTFVFRLSGRERQQSASYYTPEVLTRFTVGQALEELLDQNGHTTSADEILNLTVCEPALGSGAFAIEAVRQLADEYLRRKQSERGETIDPDEYPRELQKVKAYLALHNVYGVDLNATAVELAEISLWLDTMSEGLQAPWFGLHLKRGNSLIGARRAVFRGDQVASKSWLTEMPRDIPLGSSEEIGAGVHHFLLPANGWGSAIKAKEAKTLAPDALKELQTWRRSVLSKPTKTQVKQLQDLAKRVEVLWKFTLQRLTIAESQIRRSIDVWGADGLPVGGAVTRAEIEASLNDPAGSYQRLKTVMNAWNAMWFWPLTESRTHGTKPPSLDEWIAGLRDLIGIAGGEVTGRGGKWRGGESMLTADTDWTELGVAEELELSLAGAKNPETVRELHPWLVVCDQIAADQGFFHWELEFAPVFAQHGGFDLQVGNPPWVRPRSDVDALLAEGDPWFQLANKPTQAQVKEKREQSLALPGITELVLDGTIDVAVTAAFLGSVQEYPHLVKLQPNLYLCFMEQTWRNQNNHGIVSMIHPESHFTDEKAGLLRGATYRRLRRHWQFMNSLFLFEVHDQVSYGVHIYAAEQEPNFINAASLYHPDTVIRSFEHNGDGPEPGLKTTDDKWDQRPHRNRLIRVDEGILNTWHAVLEDDDVPVGQTRMVYTVNRASTEVLAKLAAAPRIGELGLKFSSGWHEKNDRTKGRFEVGWGRPDSWEDVILQGPHIHVGNPFYKTPNPTMKHNQDWSPVDLESLPSDAIPVTQYKPAGDRAVYDAAYTNWGTPESPDSARNHYRIAWRAMAANTGERTLIPAVIPPGVAHVNGVFAVGYGTGEGTGTQLLTVAAFAVSLLADYVVRVAPKSGVYLNVFERIPFKDTEHTPALVSRMLRLVCLTKTYAPLWDEVENELRLNLGSWTESSPIRDRAGRTQTLIEIDAYVAASLNISAEEWETIYTTAFPVLHKYDRKHGIDRSANIRQIFKLLSNGNRSL